MTQVPTREALLHLLYEAAELEHTLMCTYLYAAFSLKTGGESEGLSPAEAAAVARWRGAILKVSLEEMGHLASVWNITAALGGAPRFGRGNFPIDAGYLPANVVVRLAPFSAEALQHFIHLERPVASDERDGDGFTPELAFRRGTTTDRITPMAIDYDTVGAFYATLGEGLRAFAAAHGEAATFCGDPALQLSPAETMLAGKPVICAKTALAAFSAIVEQGEGAPAHSERSHFAMFMAIRDELAALHRANPAFEPALPAAHNPVLRPPPRPQGRVWIEDETAAATVDVANTGYALMLRLIAYAYTVPRPEPEKALAMDLAVNLMRAITPLAERAARLPAGPSNPGVNAGMSFTTLREAAAVPAASAGRVFLERFDELVAYATRLAEGGDPRCVTARRMITDLAARAKAGFAAAAARPRVSLPIAPAAPVPVPVPVTVDGVDHIEGKDLTLLFEAKRCIHSRHCVTGAPKVFVANVEGPWIHPDEMDVELLTGIAHVCPSGAIRYQRKDGRPEEPVPPVNLIAIREAGPYAVRGEVQLAGVPAPYRATLCRCGGSKNKPFCDGTHHAINFAASGEPPTGDATAMLDVRDGVLAIDPQTDGPLQIRGNLEITSGTGRVVARVQQTRLCRCGGSSTKPFCDGTHATIGFRST